MNSKINKYYDKSKKDSQKFFDHDKQYELIFEKSSNSSSEYIVNVVYNKNKSVKCNYEIIGMYNVVLSQWIWSYAMYVEKNLTNLVSNIKLNKNEYANDELALFYVDNTTFFLSYKNLQDFINFTLYMVKGKWILSHKLNDSQIEFIVITKIITN